MLRIIGQLSSGYRRRNKPIDQSKFRQFAHRVRQGIDTDTQRFNGIDALEDADFHADLMQAQRRRQPGDARADDQNSHGRTLRKVCLDAYLSHRCRPG